ncbi:MAG: hypothetical protein CMF55_01880 [Legionellales bacterium]|nr:hypothetical protein [Legionellales bacterium]HAG61623.1 hypothetical protein [Coxiellaceae bacterium]
MPHTNKPNYESTPYDKNAAIDAWINDFTTWSKETPRAIAINDDFIEWFKALLDHHIDHYGVTMRLMPPKNIGSSDCRRIVHQVPFWFYTFQISAVINYKDCLNLYTEGVFLMPMIINHGANDRPIFLGQTTSTTSEDDITTTSHLHNETKQPYAFHQYQSTQGLRNKNDLTLKQWAKAIASSELCWQRYETLGLPSQWMKTLCNSKLLLEETHHKKQSFFSYHSSDTDRLAFIPLVNTPHNKHEVMLQAVKINPHGKISHQSYWTFQVNDLIDFKKLDPSSSETYAYQTAQNSTGKSARFMYCSTENGWELHGMTTEAHEIKKGDEKTTVTSPIHSL